MTTQWDDSMKATHQDGYSMSIEEIRERWLDPDLLLYAEGRSIAYKDIRTLLAEIDRLHGEFLAMSENNEYLKAENAKLREALEPLLADYKDAATEWVEEVRERVAPLIDAATQALEDK